jgi:hypothetical protein
MSMPANLYGTEVFLTVIERVRGGAALTEICGRDGLPSFKTVYRRLDADPKLAEEYAAALSARRTSIKE